MSTVTKRTEKKEFINKELRKLPSIEKILEREEIQAEVVKHSPLLVTQAVQEVGKDVHVVVKIGTQDIKTSIRGVIRALVRSGIRVEKGIKLEIDPTENIEYCYAIRAKMRAITGGVLEAILTRFNA